MPAWSAPKVSWPSAGSGSASWHALGLVSAGSTGVSVGAAAAPDRGAAGTVPAGSVRVDTLGASVASKLGGLGQVFTVRPGSAASGGQAVQVRVDVSGFAAAGGGDLESRLHLVQVPACAVAAVTAGKPVPAGCTGFVDLPSTVDLSNGTVSGFAMLPSTAPATTTATGTTAAGAAAAGVVAVSGSSRLLHGGTTAAVGSLAPTTGTGVASQATLVGSAPAATSSTSGTTVMLASSTSSSQGSYAATPLTVADKWSVGLQSGSFTYSYPLPAIPALGGPTPSVSLDYSSASVDGMTSADNAQASNVGLGWSLNLPYIERQYDSCASEGYTAHAGSLCYAGEHYIMSFGGKVSALVPDTTTTPVHGATVYRMQADSGVLVEHLAYGDPAYNGDNNGELWYVYTPDGTQYTFGRGSVIVNGVKTMTNAVETVPVYGNNSWEPCYPSVCQQAWRWNLGGVVDTVGNQAIYFYTPETNVYSDNGVLRTYDRAADLARIEYSNKWGSTGSTQPQARVVFTNRSRCNSADYNRFTNLFPSCPSVTAANASSYPDVPTDLICTTSCSVTSPTFFSQDLLRVVQSERWDGSTWQNVDQVDLAYQFPNNTDGSTPSLWLTRVQHFGYDTPTTASIADPYVEFAGTLLNNRVDYNVSAGVLPLKKARVTTISGTFGDVTRISYGQPQGCTVSTLPSPATNAQDCFPRYFVPAGWTGGWGWFAKYVTTQVSTSSPTNAGDSSTVTTRYVYGGSPAWHHDMNTVAPMSQQSWSDWRGYDQVDVEHMSDPTYRGQSSATVLSTTRYLILRGMNRDATASGGTKTYALTDTMGTVTYDWQYDEGLVMEVETYLTPTPSSSLNTAVIHGYAGVWISKPPASADPNTDGYYMKENQRFIIQRVVSDSGTVSSRMVKHLVTYDGTGTYTGTGQLLSDEVTDGTAADASCTSYQYTTAADTITLHRLNYPAVVTAQAGTCAAPTALVSQQEFFYDGSTTLAAGIGAGLVTMTKTASAGSGSSVSHWITTSATYDTYGRTLTATNGRGKTTTTSYSPSTGIPATVTVTDPLGHATVTALDAGRFTPTSVTNPNGGVTHYGYDDDGRLTGVWLPGQSTSGSPSYSYVYHVDSTKAVPPYVDSRRLQPNGTYLTSTQFYDALLRPIQTQTVAPTSTSASPVTTVVNTRYDDRGLLAATSQPVAVAATSGAGLLTIPRTVNETRYGYDAADRLSGTGFDSNNTQLWLTTTSYYGDHTRVTPPTGGVMTTTWTDPLGRTVRKDQGTGSLLASTTYTVDTAGRVTKITDPAGHVSSYTYDLAGRRTVSVDADAGTTTTTFDDDGNPVTTTTATGQVTTDVYDAADRLTQVWSGPASTGTLLDAYSFDTATNGVGLPASSTTYGQGGTYSVAVAGYDVRGRSTGSVFTFPAVAGLSAPLTVNVGVGYDVADRPTTLSYGQALGGLPAETVTTGYNMVGLADTLMGNGPTGTYVSGTSYDGVGRLSGRVVDASPGPLVRAYTYQASTGRLSTVLTTGGVGAGAVSIQSDTYSWDPSGNLTSVVDGTASPAVATCDSYDGLGRVVHAWTTTTTNCSDSASITTAAGWAGFNTRWGYTLDGNLTSIGATGQSPAPPVGYGDSAHPHAATSFNGATYTYRADGNLTSATTSGGVSSSYGWDALGHLSSVTSGASTTGLVQDAAGNRLARFNPDGTVDLYLTGEDLHVSGGQVTGGHRYYTSGGTVVAVRDGNGTLTWQVNDTQGSAQIQLVQGASTASRMFYDPYGAIRGGSDTPATEKGWLDATLDPSTGLTQLGARYYLSVLGRFATPDPLNVQASAQTANAYAYANNNPVAYSDPTGLIAVYPGGEVSDPQRGYKTRGSIIGGGPTSPDYQGRTYTPQDLPGTPAPGMVLRFATGFVDGAIATVKGLVKMGGLFTAPDPQTVIAQTQTALAIVHRPATLWDTFTAPYNERTSHGDTAGALGYGTAQLLLALAGGKGAGALADSGTAAAETAAGAEAEVAGSGLPALGAKPNFANPAEAPGGSWEWRGTGEAGSSKGSWYNPNTGESLHPDLEHPEPIGPHYDWKAPNGTTYRVYPDGTVTPK